MISAVAISFNEADNIERYIKSLAFADEIIIIDSYSTDNTVALAKQLGAKVIQREFDNFSNQRNFAIDQARYDWVVFFDLDEVISEDLANEITGIVHSEQPLKAYHVKRDFYFMGKQMRYSGFQTDVSVRLFHKKYCRYNGKAVHETIATKEKIGRLKHSVKHYTYKSFDDYNDKLTHYSKLQAKVLYDKNIRPNLYHFLCRPLYRFLHQYIIRLGFLDGKEGFILCYVHGFSVFKRYAQLWLMYRDIE